MNTIRLPKSNCEWEVSMDTGGPHQTRITALLNLPDRTRVANSAVLYNERLFDGRYVAAAVDHLLEDMAREVGRKMVGVSR